MNNEKMKWVFYRDVGWKKVSIDTPDPNEETKNKNEQ